MDLSSAVLWWEEWQLRILVLGSLFAQYILLFSAPLRKRAIPSWFRSIIWLAYLGSDALAIYALATLFNRQRRQDCSSGQGNSILEVVWAPVLLMHLGGQDSITAYNIEDNELWTRHVLTAVSQITVAIFVLSKSWRGGDNRLLKAAIMFFIPGVLKCLEKPWTLKNASINSLVSSSDPAHGTISNVDEIKTLQAYLQEATTDCVEAHHNRELQEQSDSVDSPSGIPPHILQPSRLFVDLASSYAERLRILTFFKHLHDKKLYDLLQEGLSNMFDSLYTKETFISTLTSSTPLRHPWLSICGYWLRGCSMHLPFSAIVLFHKSHGAYNDIDVKITYALFCCTLVLELYPVLLKFSNVSSYSRLVRLREGLDLGFGKPRLSVMVAQYSLVGFFSRNKRHTKTMCVVSLLQCKDFLDQRWCVKPCDSSFFITKLVLQYVKSGWKYKIKNVDSYWKFNDHRGQWTLENKCNQDLVWSLRRPFDESILLWHITTDFCFYYMGASVDHQCAIAWCTQDYAFGQDHGCAAWCESVVRCKEISNYMMYLLFVNPEMLMAGTRRNLFIAANAEVEELLKDEKPLLKKILKGKNLSLREILNGKMSWLKEILKSDTSMLEIIKGKMSRLKEIIRNKNQSPGAASSTDTKIHMAENKWLEKIERGVVQAIVAKLESTECSEQVACTESPTGAEKNATAQQGFLRDALRLHKGLLALGNERMWDVIEGVWVEMLCFSASRCRGYLHAKSLGNGGELLTVVWLLLSHMGMETLPERLQRTELSIPRGNGATPASTSQIYGIEYPARFRRTRPHEEAAAIGASTSQPYRSTC